MPRRTGALALLLAGALALGGCASMSPEECRTADWRERGLRDGLDGAPRSRFADHVEACTQVGVKPDQKRYMRGYEEGLQSFCTPSNGADFGERGRYYTRGTCPIELEADFERAYRRGKAVYDARQKLDRAYDRQRSKEREFDRARNDETRRRLRHEMKDLDREIMRARDEVRRAERDLSEYFRRY